MEEIHGTCSRYCTTVLHLGTKLRYYEKPTYISMECALRSLVRECLRAYTCDCRRIIPAKIIVGGLGTFIDLSKYSNDGYVTLRQLQEVCVVMKQ